MILAIFITLFLSYRQEKRIAQYRAEIVRIEEEIQATNERFNQWQREQIDIAFKNI